MLIITEQEEIAIHEYTADEINAELAQLGDEFFNHAFEEFLKKF